MKHPSSRQLHAYWDRLRGGRAAPERGEIEPGAIRTLLADSFILETDTVRRSGTVRLAGTRLCALFGRELRGTPFAALWGEPRPPAADDASPDPRPNLRADPWQLVETVACDTVGLVAGLTGTTARGETLDLELLLLPLRYRGKTQARILGSLSPHAIPTWLGTRPILRVESVSQRVLAHRPGRWPTDFGQGRYAIPEEAVVGRAAPDRHFADSLPSPANDARPVRFGHLLVHEGGRAGG